MAIPALRSQDHGVKKGWSGAKGCQGATCTEDGYTGDEVCTICGEIVKKGRVIRPPAISTRMASGAPSAAPLIPNSPLSRRWRREQHRLRVLVMASAALLAAAVVVLPRKKAPAKRKNSLGMIPHPTSRDAPYLSVSLGGFRRGLAIFATHTCRRTGLHLTLPLRAAKRCEGAAGLDTAQSSPWAAARLPSA